MARLPARPVVGILHPGAMGAALGSALKATASGVIWAAAGRSDATSKRAELADLIGVPDVAELARRSDVIVSICPPDAAIGVAEEVAAALAGRAARPVYVDANAVAPATVERIAQLLGPEHVVDGAVIGPPGWERGTTVLWLAGAAASEVAALFAGSPFDARALPGPLGAASALKACYAVQSKAIPAAWFAMAAAAHHYGVADELGAELVRTHAEHPGLSEVAPRARRNAWRWAGEMDEAAVAFAGAGLPGEFSAAAAQVYRRIADAGEQEQHDVWGL